MFHPNNHFITIGNVGLNVYEWGTSLQPPLIFLHGLASTSHMFDLIAPQFAANYRVIAYDQRGHGLSDKPDTGYDFETISADLDQLVVELGLTSRKFTLAGHSWGAYTALYYAATRPTRLNNAILIDGGLRPMSDHFSQVDDMAPPQHRNWPLTEVKRMIREDWLGVAFRPELEPLVLSIYDTSDAFDVQPHLKLANHMQIARALWNFNSKDYYSLVQCPMLIINAVDTGESPDPQFKMTIADAQQLLRNSKAVWMPNTSHDVPWHRPQELVSVMRQFLQE